MDPLWTLLYTALCFGQALLISCARSSSYFRSEPLSTVQKQGGTVFLRCAARQPSARLSWLFQGHPLEVGSAGGEVRLGPDSLTLPSLQPSQAGHYQCVAHTETGAVASRLAWVTVAEMSEFGESHRRTVAVEQGSTAMIECHLPRSNPASLPRLRVRGQWLELSTDNYLILPSGNLQIGSVSSDHQGAYKCAAFNPVTQETKLEDHSTRLLVRNAGTPMLVRVLYPTTQQTLIAMQAEDLTLECVLSGSPPPAARWTKDGEEVAMESGRRLVLNNLVLMGVSRRDEGFYQCTAWSEAGGLVSANYTVLVREPVSVLQGLTDQSLSAGSSVVFSCMAKGNPTPNVTWLFNSIPVTPSKRLKISGSSLRITDIAAEDQGIYQCLFDNGIGSAQSAGALMVQSGLSSIPAIWSPPSSGSFQEGDYVSLSCNASGRPLPVIRWYNAAGPIATHPSRILQPSKTSPRASADTAPYLTVSRPGSSSLFIQAVTLAQAGTYVCEASNNMGSVRSEAFVSVVSLLSATLAPMTDSPVSISLVQSDEGKEPLVQEEEEEEAEPNYSLDTPTGRVSDLPTPEAPIITSPPQTRKHDVYDLEWRPGKDWGHPINTYFVRYRKLDDAGNVAGGWHTVRVPGSEKSLRLSDLEPSSLYEVLMVARSAAGNGQPAMLTFRTAKERTISSNKSPSKAPYLALPEKTQEHEGPNTHFGVVMHDRVPGAPDRPTVSMASENSVYVTWIPRANGGSPITAFRVEYRRQVRGSEWAVAADNISPLKLSVEVGGLEPGSTYRFRVIALNMYGESTHSAPSKPYQVSPASPPFSVRPVVGPHISSTDAVSDTQIMLRWTYSSSSNNNTPIQGFYIYYRPTDSDNDSDYKRDVVEGNRQWHLIAQLQPETSYDIKMQCFNDGGESEYSNVMICETKARQPPGVPPEDPVTPPGPYLPAASMPPGGLLYLIVGSVLGVMVLILLVFIAMCLWRNRQQRSVHKYDPPGYLYQPAEMNCYVMEYATLPGSSHTNGYGRGGHLPPPSCHHVHHKLPNGIAALNGSAALCPSGHAHNGPLPNGSLERDHAHSHHRHNGGGIYTALPQSESSDCMSCQNFCNNNRCYTKANGILSGGSLPIMHHMTPCTQDGLELVLLARVTPPLDSPDSQRRAGEQSGERLEELDEAQMVPPPSQHSCCQSGEHQHATVEDGEEDVSYGSSESQEVCWASLDLPQLDCGEKTAWVTLGGHSGDLVRPAAQEA